MIINSTSFIDSPVHHEFPPLYEGLGLAELSAFVEQRFEFSFTFGKTEQKGLGSIRLYKKNKHMKVVISEKLQRVGPVRLQKLKDLLLEELSDPFIENIEFDTKKRKVFHAVFRRPAQGGE
ncbi:hypothetical protein [Bacillus sp. T33-2]|uniref:hypothetical protein n=1 Tax=Bacillus sp. T33-2 TaxID=2054168 RepID=UPI000C77AE80|nr:hypothetical protein [Bacillus sp. T33-2]PLR89774.1 hypothetical protein CVD19_23510 [Bacillus sp. T33-2]